MTRKRKTHNGKPKSQGQSQLKMFSPNWQQLYGGSSTGSYDSFGGQPEPSKLDLVRGVTDVVAACTTLIKHRIAQVPIRLYVKTYQGQQRPKCLTGPVDRKTYHRLAQTKHLPLSGTVDEVLEHPILDLLRKCNASHNQADLMSLLVESLDVLGNAFLLMEEDGGSLPCELYFLPAQYMWPERSSDLVVRSWKFGQGTEQKTYSPADVIHFKYSNLQDPYVEGVSPLRQVWQRVQIGLKTLGYLDNVLSNQGRPDSVISISESTFPDEMERISKEYYQRYRGAGNGGPIFLDGKMSFAPLSWPPKDMAELQLYQVVKTSVCNAFNFPPDLLELGTSSNRSTREAAIYCLATDCLKPRLANIVERLNERLVPLFDDRLFLCADEVVPEDKEFKLQEVQMLLSQGVLTREEARKAYALDEADWATVPLLPSGMMPAPSAHEDEATLTEDLAPLPPTQEELNARSTAVAALQAAYYGGQMPRSAAVANAVLTLGFTQEQAEALLPEAPAKPAEQPPAPAEQPAAPPPEQPPGGKSFEQAPGQGEAKKLKALAVPDYRQSGDYDCGAAAAHAVCGFFGVGPKTEAEFIEALGTTPEDGTRPPHIIALLEKLGLAVWAKDGLSPDDLSISTDNGCPVIVCIQDYGTPEEEAAEQSGHYVVVCGVDADGVVLQDPSAGQVKMDLDTFLTNWKDRDADGTEYVHYGIAVSRPQGKIRKKSIKPLAKRSPEALEKALKGFFARQSAGVHAKLKELDQAAVSLKAVGPEWFDVEAWTREMYREVLPTVAIYYDHAAQETVTRLGADANLFNVVQPNLKKGMEKATLLFCQETNRATSLELDQALTQLRDQLTEGVSQGEVKQELAERVKGVFDQAENYRAFRIGATEANRMQHAAVEITRRNPAWPPGSGGY